MPTLAGEIETRESLYSKLATNVIEAAVFR